MKRSRLLNGLIASLLAIPYFTQASRPVRKAPRKEFAIAPFSAEDRSLVHFAQPVSLTPAGIKKFLRSTYNHHEYGSEFLPNNFSHLQQFLKRGKEAHQKRAYVQSVFRLFSNKLKSSSYVNAYAFSDLLEELPKIIADYFVITPPNKNTAAIQTQINEMLYSRFLSQFQSFKNNPTEFLGVLSQDILETIQQQELILPTDSMPVEELRKTVLMFLEVGLNKLIWNPEDQIETWRSLKQTADHLNGLFEQGIIVDQDDLNDLFRTLIERYCLFIDITGTDLSMDFFNHVKKDIESQSLLLLDLEEEEDVESKYERLMRSFTQAHEKALIKRKKARTEK